MALATNTMPTLQATEGPRNHGFDFSKMATVGLPLASATVTLEVVAGVDAGVGSLINGSATISGAQVIVSIGPYPAVTADNSVTYKRTCVATATDGQKYTLYTFFTVEL